MKRLINIQVSWLSGRLSIKESSEQILKVLKSLYESDRQFEKPILSKENHDEVIIDLNSTSEVEIVNILSQAILKFSKNDILKYEGDENPTIEYSRDIGFSFVLKYRDLVSFSVFIGNSAAGGMSTLSLTNTNIDWCFSVLKGLINAGNVKEGALDIRDLKFNRSSKIYQAPLGWVTYFSNDYEIPIPDDLEGIEYEHTDKGKYLILTREDFTTDKETYEAHKQKLLGVMEEIKRRVPKYSK